ncbi:hypothetical protein TWF694_006088 [Orbilia ellipsospora]|uniref:CHAT domain-containing protein n=1 Tax=Orbilia ellipsospora TaxID=2528407 RepID=A0AAV9WS82_9PEZI
MEHHEITSADGALKRFTKQDDLDSLQVGIEKREEAAAATRDDDPNKVRALDQIATALHLRFKRTGHLDDLDIAIERGKQASILADYLPKGNEAEKAEILNNLASFYLSRFERTRDLNDLNTAAQRCEEALSLVPENYPYLVRMLGNLSTMFGSKFAKTGNLDDLQMAIQKGEEAAGLALAHEEKEGLLRNLSMFLRDRFRRLGNPADLRKAIEKGEEAVSITPEDHPNRAVVLDNLAWLYQIKFKNTKEPADSERSLELFLGAVEAPNSPPFQRIRSWKKVTYQLVLHDRPGEAARIADMAVNLLPMVVSRQLNQQDQQSILSPFYGLASWAVVLSLEAQKGAYHCVRLLEVGRGIFTGMRFGVRSDLTDLRVQHPELAQKFENLRDVLDARTSAIDSEIAKSIDSASPSFQRVHERHSANSQMDETLNQIRRLPDFENFLLPPGIDEIMAAAIEGPVVIINVSLRCDALIVEKKSIWQLPLPNLIEADIENNVKLVQSIRSAHILSQNDTEEMYRMLEWLWDSAVSPILEGLGCTKTPSDDEDWPRVFWIPTGHLSLLPLHAAGYHTPPYSKATLDRVVSSYSTSIKSLLYARRMQKLEKSHKFTNSKALLVAMSRTPGNADLRFAKEEVDMLNKLLPVSIPRVTLEQPCRKEVVTAFNVCNIFHFAGHGESISSDPSRSGLLVNDWQTNPLTVGHFVKLKFLQKSPWLAYLSACSTSDAGSQGLQDEALHLVSACQLAGFQHVVGSLWEVSDRHSVDMAEEMYKTIANYGVVEGWTVSLGVHRAARRLRNTTYEESMKRNSEQPLDYQISIGETYDETERGTRRVRPQGWKERDKTKRSEPFVWAAYIHCGP